jgi:hypothetical protein
LRLALLATLAGCWPYVAPPDRVVEPLRLQPRKKRTCTALETMAGQVPETPDIEVRCGHHLIDGDRWLCAWNEMAYHAGNLRYWIDKATSECAP